MTIFKKVNAFDWIGLPAILGCGYFWGLIFPALELFPRFGALCVIVALFIAGSNSKSPIYENFDGMDIGKLPPLPDFGEESPAYQDTLLERKNKAEKARDALFVRVPLWAGIGTLIWGFGDLI